jgi:hypothetical protein
MGFEKIIEFQPARELIVAQREAPREREPHVKELIDMLSYRRPNGSKTERRFIRRYLSPLGCEVDKLGNYHKRIGDAPIMWSCHTDTVHKHGGRQNLRILGDTVHVADAQSNCLGADCTAGVWLMVQMIRAEVPGLYIFHRAEECGGVGSAHIAETTPELVKDIQFAIAFDRKAKHSIITHQWGGRCCSKAFAESLSTALGMDHVTDSGGSFTDTASYVDIIGECTNLSVGYQDEHQRTETLDLDYIARLRAALLAADFNDLIAERKPGEVDREDYGFDSNWRQHGVYSGGAYTSSYTRGFYDDDQSVTGFRKSGYSLYALVRDNPAEVADWLEEYGISIEELEEALYMRGAVLRTDA